MIKAGFDPAEHQVVICPKCGEQIPLQPYQTTESSLFVVSCPVRCGRFAILSRFRMVSGAQCPRCEQQKIMVLKRHPYTEGMVALLREQGLTLYRFTAHGGIELLDWKEVRNP